MLHLIYKALFMTVSAWREQYNHKILTVSKDQLRAIKEHHLGKGRPYMSMNLIIERLVEKEFKRLKLKLPEKVDNAVQ